MKKIAFITVAEKQIYEQQAVLLCKSIMKFITNVEFDIFVFSPRKNNKPSKKTKDFFFKNDIIHIENDLNIKHDFFPLANSLYAADYFEKNYNGYDSILLCDCDTVFLNPFSDLFFEKETVFAKIVDNIGVGTGGKNHKNEVFWHDFFNHFKLPLADPDEETTVRVEKIRPYFNSGFVLTNKVPGFFIQWLEDFIELMESGIKPNYIGRDGTNFGFFEQLALSITLAKYNNNYTLLPQTYNYPIPFRPILKDRPKHPRFDELVHVHYHRWFQHPGFLDYITDEEEKKSEQYLWLKEHLPLLPTIDGPFKC